jgi:hypothetical protein
MKITAAVVLGSIGIAATAIQAFFAWALTQTSAKQQFVSLYSGIYGGVPRWTQLMFGLDQFVWLLPAISTALVVLALYRRGKPPLSSAAAIAVLLLLGMLYAMYPIHLMMTTSVI